MSSPRIALATLALNEIEWLEALWRQHKDWPGLIPGAWAFVEAADVAYADANPDAVSPDGLSVDGTTEWLEGQDGILYEPMGFVGDGSAQGKCAARARYLEMLEPVAPDWVIVLDADEFVTHEDQRRIVEHLEHMAQHGRAKQAITYRQRHVWRPASIAGEPLMGLEVVGGYWKVPHTRIWPWSPGITYKQNHNWPELPTGEFLNRRALRLEGPGQPECVHMGFAASLQDRQRKSLYYQNRGEGARDGRSMYVECRAAWEDWKPGDDLPHGARVIAYENGPVPECFL